MTEDNTKLTVTLKYREPIYVGDNISFTILKQKGSQLSVCVSAPREVKIRREERYEKEMLAQEIDALEKITTK